MEILGKLLMSIVLLFLLAVALGMLGVVGRVLTGCSTPGAVAIPTSSSHAESGLASRFGTSPEQTSLIF